MERHNRKSYLAPEPPKSLKEEASQPSPSPAVAKPVSSKSSRAPQYPPSSGDIPLNIPVETPPSHPRNYQYPPNPSPQPVRTTRSPPLSLEHLSLETKEDEYRSSRRPSRAHLVDPISAVNAPVRPSMSSRSASSHNTKSRMPLQSSTHPVRAAPPPSGPPPPMPTPGGGSWPRQPGSMRGGGNMTGAV